MTHTILLVQSSSNASTRTWYDHESWQEACDQVCSLFEARLADRNPSKRRIEYAIEDLYKFIDDLHDLGALVFDAESNSYRPRAKAWIKQRCLKRLKQISQQGAANASDSGGRRRDGAATSNNRKRAKT